VIFPEAEAAAETEEEIQGSDTESEPDTAKSASTEIDLLVVVDVI